jgi:predicted glycosyltransferase
MPQIHKNALSSLRSARRRPRVAFYSHDTMGLGHLRRNLLIAQTLANSELRATSLLITGAHETNFFSLPDGIDCLTLPRIYKDLRGKYQSAKLDISVHELTQLRQKSICSALEQFAPEILIVDKVPAGARGELLPALELLAELGHTRCILGLRDILDDSTVVRYEWLNQRNVEAIEQFYDAIWIYGDRRVYDAVREYGFPDSISKKARFAGYLDQASRISATFGHNGRDANGTSPLQRKKVVCAVGGGQDGAKLVETFIDALHPDIDGVVLTGPYLPQPTLQAAKQAAALRPNLQIVDFTPEADVFIAGADRVVGMAGYNTVCSVLSFCRPALLVPRLTPRREQWIRAERLRELRLVDVISPEQLNPTNLAAWLNQPVDHFANARSLVDLSGLDRIVEWAGALLTGVSEHFERAPHSMVQPTLGDVPR